MPIASSVLDRFVSAVDEEGLGAYGVHVLIGDDAVQHRWRSDDRENIYSASKGVCALAIGMAIDEGIVSLDSPVLELLPAMNLGVGVETVTLRHLLTMSSGIDFAWFGDERVPGPISRRRCCASPLVDLVLRSSTPTRAPTFRCACSALLSAMCAAACFATAAACPAEDMDRRG